MAQIHASYGLGRRIFVHSQSPRVRRLEVEHKFIVTPPSLAYLRSGGEGRFKKHESPCNKRYHDVYYDREGSLFGSGIYIRKRNGKWEAKLRAGGDFINSAFEETDDSRSILDMVKQNLDVARDCHSIENVLSPCAEFITERESWMIDDKFQVDVDSTDFGHRVGEVELTRYLGDTYNELGSDRKTVEEDLMAKMDMDITAFMQSHPRAFPTGRPIGKLSAYFEWIKKS